MRKILSFAGVLVAGSLVTACNPPPLKQACNCHGTAATAKSQRLVTPGSSESIAPPAMHHRRHGHRARAYAYRDYNHGGAYYDTNDSGAYDRNDASNGSDANDSSTSRDSGDSNYASDNSYGGGSAYGNARVSSYNYRSTSHIYYNDSSSPGENQYGGDYTHGYSYNDGGNTHGYSQNDGGYTHGYSQNGGGGDGWQDGYGRWHSRLQLRPGERAARMDPWHGYDVYCPDGNGDRY